jgi:hypothetical protein
LHVRIDATPKYYQHAEYKNPAYQREIINNPLNKNHENRKSSSPSNYGSSSNLNSRNSGYNSGYKKSLSREEQLIEEVESFKKKVRELEGENNELRNRLQL